MAGKPWRDVASLLLNLSCWLLGESPKQALHPQSPSPHQKHHTHLSFCSSAPAFPSLQSLLPKCQSNRSRDSKHRVLHCMGVTSSPQVTSPPAAGWCCFAVPAAACSRDGGTRLGCVWGGSPHLYASCWSGTCKVYPTQRWVTSVYVLCHQVRGGPSGNAENSDIWSRNFYLSLKETIRNFQAVCWQMLLLLPCGKTDSEFHLMKTGTDPLPEQVLLS